MTIDPQQAAAALGEIAGAECRTREVLIYARSSTILIMWGVIVALGYVGEHFWPTRGALIWIAANGLGFLGTGVLATAARRADGIRLWDRRFAWAMLVLVVFGFIWSLVIGQMSPRQCDAFWPTLFMFGYVLAGIWLGRFFIWCGVAVTALTLVGYFWTGPWFQLWMAAIEGAALIGGGLWLRRFG